MWWGGTVAGTGSDLGAGAGAGTGVGTEAEAGVGLGVSVGAGAVCRGCGRALLCAFGVVAAGAKGTSGAAGTRLPAAPPPPPTTLSAVRPIGADGRSAP